MDIATDMPRILTRLHTLKRRGLQDTCEYKKLSAEFKVVDQELHNALKWAAKKNLPTAKQVSESKGAYLAKIFRAYQAEVGV